MPGARLGSQLLFWMAAACLMSWGQLPARLRRAFSLLLSAAGVLFLVLGLNAEGQRDAAITGSFLLGSSYVTGQATAAASLPYYFMTAVCLLLGAVGAALPEAVADRLADHRIASAVAFSGLVTLVRFGLEQAAAPPSWVRLAGITALAPVVGAYLALTLDHPRRRLAAFLLDLLVYSLAVRAWVALLYVTATGFRLGSHLDLSSVARITLPFVGERQFEPGSWNQLLNLAILPQLSFWPLFTMLAGSLGGGLALLVSWAGRKTRSGGSRAVPAGDEGGAGPRPPRIR